MSAAERSAVSSRRRPTSIEGYRAVGRRLPRVLLWTGAALVIGVGFMAATVSVTWPDSPVDGAPSPSVEILVHLVFGVLTIAVLPVVLYRDGRPIPLGTLHPKVLAAEKLRGFLEDINLGGVEYLAEDGSVESLQRRTGGWIPVVLGLVGVLIGSMSLLGSFAASILIISLCARRSWTVIGLTTVTTIISQGLSYVITPHSMGDFDLPVFLAGGTTFAIIVIIGVIRGAREQGFIDTAAQTLLRERSRQDRAVAEVRRGIARDMHDSLSHHLSVIAMYAGALSVRQDLDPEAVRESARLIAAGARRSRVELREVLTMLRGDDQGTVVDPDLDRLIAAHRDAVTLEYVNALSPAALGRLGTLERTTIYRFVQEAITNAVKHAPGQPLRITVGRESADIVLCASNSRAPLEPTHGHARQTNGTGLGLLGLKERMEAMGGVLGTRTHPDFELHARIPVHGVEDSTAGSGFAVPADAVSPAPPRDSGSAGTRSPAPSDSSPPAEEFPA